MVPWHSRPLMLSLSPHRFNTWQCAALSGTLSSQQPQPAPTGGAGLLSKYLNFKVGFVATCVTNWPLTGWLDSNIVGRQASCLHSSCQGAPVPGNSLLPFSANQNTSYWAQDVTHGCCLSLGGSRLDINLQNIWLYISASQAKVYWLF